MEIIRCNNGHFYDSEENDTCPYCSGKIVKVPEDILPTDCFHTTHKTADAVPPTEAADKGGDHARKVEEYPDTASASKVEQPGPTAPVKPQGKQGQEQADLVGWLVCIEGPSRGKDYRIRNQNNYIGRNPDSDICIPEDSCISADRSANIVYDYVTRCCFFGPLMGKNPVRVNGGIVINSAQLQAYDVLQVGMTKLLFVPLCGDRFDWNEK